MKYVPIPTERLLAIDPITKGFGFVVLEVEPLQLIDWGTKTCARSIEGLGRVVESLLWRYGPTVFVLEDPAPARTEARRAVLHHVVALCAAVLPRETELDCVSAFRIRDVFPSAGGHSKRVLAALLSNAFPEIQGDLPPQRMLWQSEDARQAVFDALALALAAVATSAPGGAP